MSGRAIVKGECRDRKGYLFLRQSGVERKVRHAAVHMTAPPDPSFPSPKIFFLIDKKTR